MENNRVKIYSSHNVPRLRYIAGIILGDILGLLWEIVTDRRKLGKYPVINYSSENIPGAFKIEPDPLLFETGIKEKEVLVSEWKGLPVFFQTLHDSDLPFDIFAAAFFMVSRYEEYFKSETDEHGRFMASSSIACKNGFLAKPVVDLWAKEFSRTLLKKYPVLAFKRNEYKALLTIDSDQPFAYLGKNLLRSFGGLIRDLTVRKGNAGERYKVVTHELKDPFEVYDFIFENVEKNQSEVKFFFPTGDHSAFDKNPSWKNEEYRQLINRTSETYETGLHPSYYSADNLALIADELSRLKTMTGKAITSARFHFIRLFTPVSYRNLCEAGISEDYSMGFPDEPGFRAGIARPFMFYDVSEDKQTSLRIIPFQIMDVTLYKYLKLNPAESKDLMFKMIEETRKSGGLFVSIWHNTSLLESEEWEGWRELFKTMLQYQK